MIRKASLLLAGAALGAIVAVSLTQTQFFAGSAAIAFVKQYAQFGLAESVPLYGAGFLTSAAYVHVQGQAADGVIASLHYVPSLDTEENRRFQSAYQAAYGKLGSEFAVQGYDAAHLIAQAIKDSGGDKQAFKALEDELLAARPRCARFYEVIADLIGSKRFRYAHCAHTHIAA